jgi:hypothetical protein
VESVPASKRVTFKLHDKQAALVNLGRHLGIFDHKHKPAVRVKVDIDDMRNTMLRALARLAGRRACSEGTRLSRPTRSCCRCIGAFTECGASGHSCGLQAFLEIRCGKW